MTNISAVEGKVEKEQKPSQSLENNRDVLDYDEGGKDYTNSTNGAHPWEDVGIEDEVYEWIKSHLIGQGNCTKFNLNLF